MRPLLPSARLLAAARAFLLLLAGVACGGGSDSTEPRTSVVGMRVLATGASSPGVPLRLVVAGGGLADSAYRGQVGGQSTAFARLNDSTLLSYVPPGAPAGAATVRVTLGAARVGEATLSVGADTPTADPLGVIDGALAAAQAALPAHAPAGVSAGAWAADLATLAAQRDSARARVRALSPAEQRAAARFAAALLAPEIAATAQRAQRAQQSGGPAYSAGSEEECAAARAAARAAVEPFVDRAAVLAGVVVAFAISPEPFTKAALILAAAATAPRALTLARALGSAYLECQNLSQIEAEFGLSDPPQSRGPFNLPTPGRAAAASVSAAAAAVAANTLVVGRRSTVKLTGTFRPLTAADIPTDPRAADIDAIEGQVIAAVQALAARVGLTIASYPPRLRDVTSAPTTTAAVPNAEATWATSNAAVATVAAGVVTGVAPGAATITATLAGKTATVSVTVEERLVISPENPRLLSLGPTCQRTDPALGCLGESVQLSASGGTPPYTWTISNPMAGRFDPSAPGRFYSQRHMATGVVTVTDSRGRKGETPVTVTTSDIAVTGSCFDGTAQGSYVVPSPALSVSSGTVSAVVNGIARVSVPVGEHTLRLENPCPRNGSYTVTAFHFFGATSVLINNGLSAGGTPTGPGTLGFQLSRAR